MGCIWEYPPPRGYVGTVAIFDFVFAFFSVFVNITFVQCSFSTEVFSVYHLVIVVDSNYLGMMKILSFLFVVISHSQHVARASQGEQIQLHTYIYNPANGYVTMSSSTFGTLMAATNFSNRSKVLPNEN